MVVPQIVEQIAELIATYTGLSVRPQDSKILERIVTQRVRSLQLPSSEAYYSLLQKAPPSTPLPVAESQREWTVLTQSITTIESYFFRDRGQFSLLRDRLLPRAIEQRRLAQQRQGSPRPSLRLWSAGCSTGEEPLSLAILLRELLPDWQEWALLILGTDINAEAIARAQAGLYPEWSFRLTPPALRDRYFQPAGDRWRIDPEVHQMVTFETGNLLGDRFPNLFSHLHDMDIILCRNVFIYFHAAAIAEILQKFHQTLRSDGCLMCAHTELSGQTLQSFQIEPFPESLVYRRACTASPTPSPAPAIPPVSTAPTVKIAPTIKRRSLLTHPPSFPPQNAPSPPPPISDGLTEVHRLLHQGAYAAALQTANALLEQYPPDANLHGAIAQTYANLGQYDRAEAHCHLALQLDFGYIEPHFILARIAQEQGDIETAKILFKRIIYLNEHAVAAYLELGSIYQLQGEAQRAKKMFLTAQQLLQKLPPEASVDGITYQSLLAEVEQILARSDRTASE